MTEEASGLPHTVGLGQCRRSRSWSTFERPAWRI